MCLAAAMNTQAVARPVAVNKRAAETMAEALRAGRMAKAMEPVEVEAEWPASNSRVQARSLSEA